MSTITRTWLAFAAIGTGLIHLALVISSPLPLGILFTALGTLEFGWGIFVLSRGRILVPRAVMIVAIAPVVAWSLAVVAAILFSTPAIASALPVVPLGVATVFELFIAAVTGITLRTANQSTTASPPGSVRYLGALMAGALAVGALTTPALAATEAGVFAQPHGEHSTVVHEDADADEIPGHEGHTP